MCTIERNILRIDSTYKCTRSERRSDSRLFRRVKEEKGWEGVSVRERKRERDREIERETVRKSERGKEGRGRRGSEGLFIFIKRLRIKHALYICPSD